MEAALIEFGKDSETRTAIIRPGNIYGFDSPCEKGIVGAFLGSILRQTPFTLIDKGRTIRDFIHVDDVCHAIDCAIMSDRPDIIWNAGTGVGTSVSDLLGLISAIGGFGMPPINNVENYASDVKANILNIDRIAVEAGWAPEIDLQSGVAKVIADWHRVDGSGAFT
jgi:UDP-glucose 4-epimerase